MKTGGTLNFLKRAGAILMLLAIFASSCNKYADDFKQLNTKLDALATQVAGVTQLSTDVAALKSQITSLASAVSALPNPTASIAALATSLTAATTKIDGITASLATLATAVGTKASTADVTKAVADVTANIKAELTAQLKTVTAAITAAQAAMVASNDAQTIAENKAIVDSNTAQSAALTAAIAAIGTQLTALNAGTAVTDAQLQASVNDLALLVRGQKAILDQILTNTNMINQDMYIASVTDMRYWLGKLSQIGIINGNVTVKTAALTAVMDSVNLITSKITAVIGGAGLNKVDIDATGTTSAKQLDLSRLVSVVGAYTVIGVDVNDANLATVGGDFTVNYDGAYTFANLTSVGGNLYLVKVATSTTKTGTISISMPNVVVASGKSVFDLLTGTAGVLTYPDASSIVLSGGVTSLTAAKATVITLGATDYTGGLTLSSSATAAAVIDLSKAVGSTSTLAISITGFGGTSVLLTKLAKAPAGLTIVTGATGTVDLSALASASTVTITGPVSISLPVLVVGALTSSSATTVSLPLHQWATPAVLVNVVTLTLGQVNANVDAGLFPKCVTLAVSGLNTAVNSTLLGSVTTSASNTVLASVNLGSVAGSALQSATISGNVLLTSLTTSGVLNALYINSNAILAGVTLGHIHDVTGLGSILSVTSNPKLTALSSGVLDYPQAIIVTGNATLATLDLSSYKTYLYPATTAATTITINTNALTGTYAYAVAMTPTSPYTETVITGAALSSLKAYILAWPTTTYPGLTLAVDLDTVTQTLATVVTTKKLSEWIPLDIDHTIANGSLAANVLGSGVGGINVKTAFKNVN